MKKDSAPRVVISAKKTDLQLDDLKGSVKQVKKTQHKAVRKNGEIVPGKIYGNEYANKNNLRTYNEQGMKVEDAFFGTKGSSRKLVYNAQGTEVEIYYYHTKTESNIHYVCVYNDQGKHLEMKCYATNGDLSSTQTWQYDERGFLTELKTVNPNGSLQLKQLFTNNADGKCTEQTMYSGDGSVSGGSRSTYNEQGLQTEWVYRNTDGTYYLFMTQRYDNKGHAIELTSYNADGSTRSHDTFQNKYDAQGNYINPYLQEIESHFQTTEYEYDHHENWIKETTLYNKKPITLILRQIAYYGEPQSEIMTTELLIIKPKSITMENKNNPQAETPLQKKLEPLTAPQAQWLGEGMHTSNVFSYLRYYILKNNEVGSQVTHDSDRNIEVLVLLRELKENIKAQVIHSVSDTTWSDNQERLSTYTLAFPQHSGYLVHVSEVTEYLSSDYETPEYYEDDEEREDTNYVFFSEIIILRPSEASGKRDMSFESDLEYYIEQCMLEEVPDKPSINMVQVNTAGQFYLQSYPVEESFEIKNLDTNYGYGFAKFHDELMQRFTTETKGLILFHGNPGTGKTYYIRHLLKKMASGNKEVIYMPPNMVDHLVDPVFMTFISQQVTRLSAEKNFCVLLIEDAEPLLASRQGDGELRILGITNLLNMTDGLINDMLKLQIICTFNVALKKLDKALLRPGRLIARKEFKPLNELDANLLAQQLGIKHHFTSSVTLAEIYAMLKNKNTLIHDVEEKE